MRRELPHYTREQVEQHLVDAMDVVDAAGVPDDLRAVAFTSVFQALSVKQVVFEEIANGVVLPR